MGIVALAYAIAKFPFRWQEIVLMGAILALIAYTIRIIGLPFGSHTLAMVLTLFIFLVYKKKEVSTAVITPLLCYGALSLYELVSLTLLMGIFNVTQEVIFTNPVNWIVFTEPQVILLFITAFMIRRKREAHA